MDPLSLNSYVVERNFGLGLMKMSFKDPNGNVVLNTKPSVFSGTELVAPDGRLLGTITHKLLAMTATYELHQGDNKSPVTGQVKVKMELLRSPGTLQEVDIMDAGGNVIATASGNFLGMQFDIKDAKGAQIATAARKMEGGVWQKLKDYSMGQYVMTIQKKDIPTLTLLEFLVVLEILMASGQSSSPGWLGGGGGFGVGVGGGGSIKF